jgi:hypothetical protein
MEYRNVILVPLLLMSLIVTFSLPQTPFRYDCVLGVVPGPTALTLPPRKRSSVCTRGRGLP